MLIEDSPDHFWQQTTMGERPIGDRETRIVAGDKGPRHHQHEASNGAQDRKSVYPLEGSPPIHLRLRLNRGNRPGRACPQLEGVHYSLGLRAQPLMLKLTSLLSLAPTVTFCSVAPNFSCQASIT